MTDRRAGFTLVEVLAALAIAGLAFAVALPMLSESLSGGAAAATEQQATLAAQSLLARVGQDIPLTDGTLHGQDGALSWTVEITPWTLGEDARPGMGVTAHHVVVSVGWPGRRRPQVLRLATLRLATPSQGWRP
jgi:prepilin-type N-terminal cleavage/methylation domain-containing protein